MRPVREITAEEENFRTEPWIGGTHRIVRRDFVEPEPVGTIVLMAFRVTGYDRDCDGSAMARLEHLSEDGSGSGWAPTHLGLYPDTDLVVTFEEWRAMFKAPGGGGPSGEGST